MEVPRFPGGQRDAKVPIPKCSTQAKTALVGSFLWIALGLMGCVAPRQYGGPIPVDQEGLADRMGLLCRVDRSKGVGCATTSDASDASAAEGSEVPRPEKAPEPNPP
jgi:hypothetical protein